MLSSLKFSSTSQLVSQPCHNVLVLSDESFQQHLDFIQYEIRGQDINIDYHQRGIDSYEEMVDNKAKAAHWHEVEKAKEYQNVFTAFHEELSMQWATEQNRILGHVLFSSPPSSSVLTSTPKMWPSLIMTPSKSIQAPSLVMLSPR